jgi:hypothetical protein
LWPLDDLAQGLGQKLGLRAVLLRPMPHLRSRQKDFVTPPIHVRAPCTKSFQPRPRTDNQQYTSFKSSEGGSAVKNIYLFPFPLCNKKKIKLNLSFLTTRAEEVR